MGRKVGSRHWSQTKTCRTATLNTSRHSGHLIRHLAERGGPNKVARRRKEGGARGVRTVQEIDGVEFSKFLNSATKKNVFGCPLKVKLRWKSDLGRKKE